MDRKKIIEMELYELKLDVNTNYGSCTQTKINDIINKRGELKKELRQINIVSQRKSKIEKIKDRIIHDNR